MRRNAAPDFITCSWLDDERRARNAVQVGSLKHREGGLFDAFDASVNFPSRRITYGAVEEVLFNIDDV
jgi:hypothetical protein